MRQEKSRERLEVPCTCWQVRKLGGKVRKKKELKEIEKKNWGHTALTGRKENLMKKKSGEKTEDKTEKIGGKRKVRKKAKIKMGEGETGLLYSVSKTARNGIFGM